MKKTLLESIYKFDDKTQTFIIDIALDSYQELFNDWDASPTWKKDLDPDLVKYLETSSYDIPRKKNIQINFFLPLEIEMQKNEDKAMRGINNYFMSELYFTRVELKYNLRKILAYIVLGFTFITTAYFIQNLTSIPFGFDILVEGVFIGGWVLLWEAFSLFFFSMYALRRKKRMYIRFLNSKILFSYKKH